MESAFANFRLVELYKQQAANKLLTVFDVDLTLRDT